jgi:hypothetical protein
MGWVLRGGTLASDFLVTGHIKMNTPFVLFLMLQLLFFKERGPFKSTINIWPLGMKSGRWFINIILFWLDSTIQYFFLIGRASEKI